MFQQTPLVRFNHKLEVHPRYAEPDDPDPCEPRLIDLGIDPACGEPVIRLVPVEGIHRHHHATEPIPGPRETHSNTHQEAIRGTPPCIIRKAIKEIQTGELDDKALLILGDINPESPAFRRLYIEARCKCYLDSPMGRHHLPPLQLLYDSGAYSHPEPIPATQPHMFVPSHAAMASRNPWAVHNLRELFVHHGPLFSFMMAASLVAAAMIQHVALPGPRWHLLWLSATLLIPALLHMRSLYGRDRMEFIRPLAAYLILYLATAFGLQIFHHFGDAFIQSFGGSGGGFYGP